MSVRGTRVFKNTTVLVVNQLIYVASSFAITVPLARLWGAGEFGRYAFAVAFSELFTFSYDWGLNQLLAREVARDKGQVAKYLSNAVGLSLLLTVFTLMFLALLVTVLGYALRASLPLYLASIWTLLQVLCSLFIRGAFHAFQKMEYETVPLFLERLFAVTFGLTVIITNRGLIALLLVLIASRVIKLGACLVVYARRIARPGIEFDWGFHRRLAMSSLPFGLSIALGLAYRRAEIAILSVITGDDAMVGYYRAAVAVTMYLPVIGLALVNSLYPIMSDLFTSNRLAFIRNYQRYLTVLVGVALPLTVGILVLGDRLVALIYGPEFTASVICVRILSLSVLFRHVHGMLSMVLTSANQQAIRTRILGAAALTNVVMSVLLIPRAGLVGTCVASVAADVLILLVSYIIVTRQFGPVELAATVIRPVLSATAMGGFVLVFRRAPLISLIPAAAVLYFAVLYSLGGVPRSAIAEVRGMLAVRRREDPR